MRVVTLARRLPQAGTDRDMWAEDLNSLSACGRLGAAHRSEHRVVKSRLARHGFGIREGDTCKIECDRGGARAG